MPAAFAARRPAGIEPQEWQLRCELAAAYRLFAQLGWHELIYNHLTVRVPGIDHFLINPFGLMYREVTASNLVKIDLEGRKVSPARGRSIPLASSCTARCMQRGPTRTA